MCSMYRVLANATLLVNLRVVCCCCYNFTCIIAYQTIQYFSILGQDKISSVFCTPLCSRHDITVLPDTQSHWARKCTVKSEWIRLAFKTESCNRIMIVLRYWFENCLDVAQPCPIKIMYSLLSMLLVLPSQFTWKSRMCFCLWTVSVIFASIFGLRLCALQLNIVWLYFN